MGQIKLGADPGDCTGGLTVMKFYFTPPHHYKNNTSTIYTSVLCRPVPFHMRSRGVDLDGIPGREKVKPHQYRRSWLTTNEVLRAADFHPTPNHHHHHRDNAISTPTRRDDQYPQPPEIQTQAACFGSVGFIHTIPRVCGVKVGGDREGLFGAGREKGDLGNSDSRGGSISDPSR